MIDVRELQGSQISILSRYKEFWIMLEYHLQICKWNYIFTVNKKKSYGKAWF